MWAKEGDFTGNGDGGNGGRMAADQGARMCGDPGAWQPEPFFFLAVPALPGC